MCGNDCGGCKKNETPIEYYQQLIIDMRIRAGIRRTANSRKSVIEDANDRLADQLEAAADAIENLIKKVY